MFITVNGQQIEDGKGNTIFDANQGKGILLQNKSQTKKMSGFSKKPIHYTQNFTLITIPGPKS